MLYMPSHIFLRSILIILPPLLHLPRSLFPSCLTTKPCMQFLFFPRHATCPFHFMLVDLMTQATICTTKIIYVKNMCSVCICWNVPFLNVCNFSWQSPCYIENTQTFTLMQIKKITILCFITMQAQEVIWLFPAMSITHSSLCIAFAAYHTLFS